MKRTWRVIGRAGPCRAQEVADHDLGHRAHAGHGGAGRGTDDRPARRSGCRGPGRARLCRGPLGDWNGPRSGPGCSSPIRKTRSSRSISSSSAWFSAAAIGCLPSDAHFLGADVLEQLEGVWWDDARAKSTASPTSPAMRCSISRAPNRRRPGSATARAGGDGIGRHRRGHHVRGHVLLPLAEVVAHEPGRCLHSTSVAASLRVRSAAAQTAT